jgi:hypothetical protein
MNNMKKTILIGKDGLLDYIYDLALQEVDEEENVDEEGDEVYFDSTKMVSIKMTDKGLEVLYDSEYEGNNPNYEDIIIEVKK